MAELVDALASGASIRKDVEVRVLFWAPFVLPLFSQIVYKTRRNARFLTLGCSSLFHQILGLLEVFVGLFVGLLENHIGKDSNWL